MSKILIFGDICPVADTKAGFESGEPRTIISDEILRLISESDLTVGNLECALIDSPSPIKKAGPVLYGSTKCATTLKAAGFDALSLANNHIRDCGTQGVVSTIEHCQADGIDTFGAGATAEDAKRPYIVEISGKKVAFLSFAEEEFNAVGLQRPGAAILDVYCDFDHLRQIKSEVDYLIVLYHGGIEYHPYPSPLLQKKCRKLVSSGADLVICQHSHCIGSYEEYDGATIVYGQGNNLFGYRKNNSGWNDGLLIQLDISNKGKKVNFIPCTTTAQSIFSILPQTQGESILSELKYRASQIQSDDFVHDQWEQFCTRAENLHLPLLLGWNRYLIFLNRKLKGLPLRLFYGRRMRNVTHNLIRCESHQEVIRSILTKYNFD